jgi:hypothetical protein
MFGLNDRSIGGAKAEIADIAAGLENFVDGEGPGNAEYAIEESVVGSFRRVVEPLAKTNAAQYVGSYANDIESVYAGWDGNTLTVGLDTDDEVVLSHEYGSGSYNPRTPTRTVDGRTGYLIRSASGPVAFNIGGSNVIVEFVIHPGVESQGFLAEAVSDTASKVLNDAGDAVHDALEESVDKG